MSRIVLARASTAGSVLAIESATFCESSPLTGLMSIPAFSASARSSRSFMAASKARRSAATRSRGVSGRLNGGVGMLLKKNKVDVIWGEASISKPGEVVVTAPKKQAMQPQHPTPKGVLEPGTYQAKNIIIATGARPRALPGIEPDGKLIWTYFEAMVRTCRKNFTINSALGSLDEKIRQLLVLRCGGKRATIDQRLPIPASLLEIPCERPRHGRVKARPTASRLRSIRLRLERPEGGCRLCGLSGDQLFASVVV